MEQDVRFKILEESQIEFDWIKKHQMDGKSKLNELVDLRNYLREYYLLTGRIKKDGALFEELLNLINEIDKYWWQLFMNGEEESNVKK